METYYFVALKCFYGIIFAMLGLAAIIMFVVIVSSLILVAIPRTISIVNQITSNVFDLLEGKLDRLSK